MTLPWASPSARLIAKTNASKTRPGRTIPFYKRGMQTYLAMQEHLEDWVGDLKLGEMEHARATFVMNMITDAIAPTNSLVTNPAAKKRAIDSGGLSLIKGLQNAYEDLTQEWRHAKSRRQIALRCR